MSHYYRIMSAVWITAWMTWGISTIGTEFEASTSSWHGVAGLAAVVFGSWIMGFLAGAETEK